MIVFLCFVVYFSIALWAIRTLCYYDYKGGNFNPLTLGDVFMFLFCIVPPFSLITIGVAIYAKFAEGDWVMPKYSPLKGLRKIILRIAAIVFLPKGAKNSE